jgi:hypothetical protein
VAPGSTLTMIVACRPSVVAPLIVSNPKMSPPCP